MSTGINAIGCILWGPWKPMVGTRGAFEFLKENSKEIRVQDRNKGMRNKKTIFGARFRHAPLWEPLGLPKGRSSWCSAEAFRNCGGAKITIFLTRRCLSPKSVKYLRFGDGSCNGAFFTIGMLKDISGLFSRSVNVKRPSQPTHPRRRLPPLLGNFHTHNHSIL